MAKNALLLVLVPLMSALGFYLGKETTKHPDLIAKPAASVAPEVDKYQLYDQELAAAGDRMNAYAHDCAFSEPYGGIPIENHGRVICLQPSSVKSIKEIKWPKIP